MILFHSITFLRPICSYGVQDIIVNELNLKKIQGFQAVKKEKGSRAQVALLPASSTPDPCNSFIKKVTFL